MTRSQPGSALSSRASRQTNVLQQPLNNLDLTSSHIADRFTFRSASLLATSFVSFALFVTPAPFALVVLGAQWALAAPLLMKFDDKTAFGLFWLAFGLALVWMPWPLPYLLPLAIFAGANTLPRTRQHLPWPAWGILNRRTVLLMGLTIVATSGALIVWTEAASPDLSTLSRMLPRGRMSWLVGVAIAFSFCNAVWEELLIKWVLWATLERCHLSPASLVGGQAAVFGLMHFVGFPSGIVGVSLAAIYGLALGFIRRSSNGIAAPVVTHFFADLTIFGIVFSSSY